MARNVQEATSKIVKYLEETGQPEPTFKQDSTVIKGNDDFDNSRVELIDAAHDLMRLVNGPLNEFRQFFTTQYELAAFQVAVEFELFTKVPLGGKIGVAELAKSAGMDEDRCGRIVRSLATQHVFNEVEPDFFEHTASSAVVARDPHVQAFLGVQLDELFKAATAAAACIQNNPEESDAGHSPFSTRHGKPLYAYYEESPTHALRFAKSMVTVAALDRPVSAVRDEYPWAELGTKGKVVDIGGGNGHVSVYLASQFPELEFVVQEVSPRMYADAEANLDPEIAKRVKFEQYDFFTEQPIKDASAFFIRQCIHNCNDRDSIKILKALVPALEKCKPGTPLLINDEILPKLNERSKYAERALRQYDMVMFVVLGAKQRTISDFEKLLKAADPRYELVKVHSSYPMGLIEIQLKA